MKNYCTDWLERAQGDHSPEPNGSGSRSCELHCLHSHWYSLFSGKPVVLKLFWSYPPPFKSFKKYGRFSGIGIWCRFIKAVALLNIVKQVICIRQWTCRDYILVVSQFTGCKLYKLHLSFIIKNVSFQKTSHSKIDDFLCENFVNCCNFFGRQWLL